MNKSIRFILLSLCVVAASCTADSPPPAPAPVTAYFPPLTGSDWATLTPGELGWKTDRLPALYEYLKATNTRAFIVLKDGKIVVEQYFGTTITNTGPFGRESVWYWASAGKTLTGFMVGKAQEEKALAIDQPTATYLGPGWTALPVAQERLITVRHQLTMTTGLDDGVANSDDTRPANQLYKAEPGTRWAYHNAPYTLLTQVVSKATNQPFEAYFDARLKTRIGMDGQWRLADDNYVFFSTPRSMARFGLLMLNGANWNGQPILADKAYVTASMTTSQVLNKSYGYLWWLNGKQSLMLPARQTVYPIPLAAEAPADMVAAMGKNGQLLCMVPSAKLVVVRMGNDPDNAPVPITYLNELWKRLNEVIE